jgi:arylsulfatase A-like enzyme
VKYGSAPVPPGCVVDSSVANVYSTDRLAQRATVWINSHASHGPWFLVVAPFASHSDGGPPVPAARHNEIFAGDPFPIPGSLNYNEADVSDKPARIRALPLLTTQDTVQRAKFHRKRREAILAVDELIASIEASIVGSGQSANTVRIFTSDNGWLNGEHRIAGNKVHAYEESARVPLIVRGPGYLIGGTLSELVGLADLAPTIVTLAARPLRGRWTERTSGRCCVAIRSSGARVCWSRRGN